MKQINSICVAGEVTRVKPKLFGDFGFVKANVGGVPISVSVSPTQDTAFISALEGAVAVALIGGYFSSVQDKKDASKWYYDVCAYPKSLSFLPVVPVVTLNQATISGTLVTTGPVVPNSVVHNWGMLSSTYYVPKTKEFKQRLVPIISNDDLRGHLNNELLVIGTVNNKYNGVYNTHVGVTGLWQM